MKYFKVERNEHEHFEVKLTEKFYELVYPFYKKDSYPSSTWRQDPAHTSPFPPL